MPLKLLYKAARSDFERGPSVYGLRASKRFGTSMMKSLLERRIIALDGARNFVSLDDDGLDVPGTRGYKYAIPSPTNTLNWTLLRYTYLDQPITPCRFTIATCPTSNTACRE
jgi:hypothetical protein